MKKKLALLAIAIALTAKTTAPNQASALGRQPKSPFR